jgi:hypothetical protein
MENKASYRPERNRDAVEKWPLSVKEWGDCHWEKWNWYLGLALARAIFCVKNTR